MSNQTQHHLHIAPDAKCPVCNVTNLAKERRVYKYISRRWAGQVVIGCGACASNDAQDPTKASVVYVNERSEANPNGKSLRFRLLN